MGAVSPTAVRLSTGESALIRSAMPDDAPELLAHGRAVVNESQFVLMHPDEFNFTLEQEQDLVRQYAQDPGKLVLVADAAGRMAGVLFFESGVRKRLAHRGTLHISVSRDLRRQGVGGALMQTLIDWAEAHPTLEKVSLAVVATNTPALSLYRKFGFIEEGCQPREIKFGTDDYADLVLMYRYV
jgi:ribosomal protein S18 acetylase RimI-like enzyme